MLNNAIVAKAIAGLQTVTTDNTVKTQKVKGILQV